MYIHTEILSPGFMGRRWNQEQSPRSMNNILILYINDHLNGKNNSSTCSISFLTFKLLKFPSSPIFILALFFYLVPTIANT